MPNDDEFDGTLLVETAAGDPSASYALLYSRWGEIYIYALPIVIVLVALVAWLAYQLSGHNSDKFTTVFLIGAVLQHWIFWAAAMGLALLPLYKIWQDAGPIRNSGVTHHQFSKEGIGLRSGDDASTIAWQDLSRVVETEKGFLFYVRGRLATVVPHKCLAGPSEIAIVRKFIRQNVPAATLLA